MNKYTQDVRQCASLRHLFAPRHEHFVTFLSVIFIHCFNFGDIIVYDKAQTYVTIYQWEGKSNMTHLPNDLHITYQLQYRKCGKASCSTCRDGQGHGPYWYAYWREGSRLRSGYIGKVSPEEAVAAAR